MTNFNYLRTYLYFRIEQLKNQTQKSTVLGIRNGHWDCGFWIGFWEWALGLGIGIGQWDYGLGFGIEIGNQDWGLGLGIEDWDWELGLGLGLGIGN